MKRLFVMSFLLKAGPALAGRYDDLQGDPAVLGGGATDDDIVLAVMIPVILFGANLVADHYKRPHYTPFKEVFAFIVIALAVGAFWVYNN